MKKKKRVLGIIGGAVAAFVLAVWLAGWFAPISAFTPYFLIDSRPSLSPYTKNMLLGNGYLNFHSPFTANLLQKAWNKDDAVYGLTALENQAKEGNPVYYSVYSEEEIRADQSKEQVGLYCLRSESQEKKPFVLMIAGGGFSSVCTPMESLPVCASFNEMGYTCFALTYRIGKEFGKFPQGEVLENLMSDVAAALSFIGENAKDFGVTTQDYLIGGFSAGGCVTSLWCNEQIGYKKYGAEKPGAACFLYGLNESDAPYQSVPSFVMFCNDDEYFKAESFDFYTDTIKGNGVSVEYSKVDCLHGFGLGTGTPAEGWTKRANEFWQEQINRS